MHNTQLIIEKSTESKMEGSVFQVQSRESHSTEMHPYVFRVTGIAVQCDDLKPNKSPTETYKCQSLSLVYDMGCRSCCHCHTFSLDLQVQNFPSVEMSGVLPALGVFCNATLNMSNAVPVP